MNTYITANDQKFDTLYAAVEAAESANLEAVELCVYSEDGKLLETQTADRRTRSGNLIYTAWAVGWNEEEDGKIIDGEIIESEINSKIEALELAEKAKAKYNRVYVCQAEGDLNENFFSTECEYV